MARKTLGKIEFEKLIESLKEQNKGQLMAQQQTTKSIRNLTAYFLKSDRARARKELEASMEERKDAQKVGYTPGGKGAGSSAKNPFGRIPSKGLFGSFMNFMMTGALGSAGSGVFKGLWNSFKWGSGFGVKLARFAGAAILVPDLWKSLSAAFKEKDFESGMKTFVNSFFKKDDAKPFGEQLASGAGKGAVLGFAVGGFPGMILGGLIGAAIMTLPKVFGKDETDVGKMYTEVKTLVKDTLFGTRGSSGAIVGGIAGAVIGKTFGPTGMIAGVMIGAGVGFLGGVLTRAVEIKDTEQTTLGQAFKKAMLEQIMKNKSLSMGLYGMGIGAAVGAFTPVGMIGGAIIGAAIGAVTGAVAEQLEVGGFGFAVRNAFRRLRKAWDEMTSGNIEQARRILRGEVAVDIPSLERQYKKGDIGKQEYISSMASMKGIDAKKLEPLNDLLDELRKRKKDIRGKSEYEVYDKLGMYERDKDVQQLVSTYKKLMKESGQDPAGYDPKIAEKAADEITTGFFPFDSDSVNKDEVGALQWMFQGRTNEIKKLEDMIEVYSDNLVTYMQNMKAGEGASAGTKKLMSMPMSVKKSAEIRDARLKQEDIEFKLFQEEMKKIYSKPFQSSENTSMPVINNSYSYQNTENTVREMPTTSSLNMMTALA